MKQLKIEWKHLDKDSKTCQRCHNTGENVTEAIENLRKDCKSYNIVFQETKLSADELFQSNIVLLNGVMIEKILGAQVSQTDCNSCSLLLGKPVSCRNFQYDGNISNDVSSDLIYQAACKILHCC